MEERLAARLSTCHDRVSTSWFQSPLIVAGNLKVVFVVKPCRVTGNDVILGVMTPAETTTRVLSVSRVASRSNMTNVHLALWQGATNEHGRQVDGNYSSYVFSRLKKAIPCSADAGAPSECRFYVSFDWQVRKNVLSRRPEAELIFNRNLVFCVRNVRFPTAS